MPPRPAPGTPADWMDRAKGKLMLARQPLPQGGYWEDLGFMAQQAAELAIKAVYQQKEWHFPFVHQLGHLLDGLEQHGMPISKVIREADKLTIYATQLRYPGSSGFTTREDYEALLATAEAVVAWAETIVAS